LAPPKPDDVRRLMHELREPLGSFAIRLSLLDEADLSRDARRHLDVMRTSVQRMAKTIGEITTAFGLEDSAALAILSDADQGRHTVER
jgi:signal transduction histidine kinase